MKMINKVLLAATVAGAGLTAATAANAAIVINITQVGANVVAAGAGSINTTGLAVVRSAAFSTIIKGSFGAVIVGVSGAQSTQYENAFLNPGTFGSGDFFFSSSGSGNNFGLYGYSVLNSIYVPVGYVSGAALAGTSTYNNQTLSGMGLTLGSYVFNVTNGDTVTVNIGPVTAAVPEATTWGMMIAGFGMMGAAMRTRRRSTKVSFA